MRYLIDTNVLLRRADADHPDNRVCGEAVVALLKADHELCLCAQVLIEFWAVSTRPTDVNGLGLLTEVASQQVSDLRETFECLPEPPNMADLWQELAETYSVQGKQAHDARLAALMRAYGISHLLTLNTQDFARYEGLTAVSPAQVAA